MSPPGTIIISGSSGGLTERLDGNLSGYLESFISRRIFVFLIAFSSVGFLFAGVCLFPGLVIEAV